MFIRKVSKEDIKSFTLIKDACNHAIRRQDCARFLFNIMNKHESAMNTNHL